MLGAVIGLQKVLVHMINSDTLQCHKVFKAVHNCLHLLLEATVDLKVDSETDESHSESGSDDNEDDEDGDSDSKDVFLILLNINSKQAKVLASFGKLPYE